MYNTTTDNNSLFIPVESDGYLTMRNCFIKGNGTDTAAIAQAIGTKLDRGATLLHAEGSYTHQRMMVVLTAVKKQQITELKELVMEIDPSAFVIVQEAHQVLGDGFSRYSQNSL